MKEAGDGKYGQACRIWMYTYKVITVRKSQRISKTNRKIPVKNVIIAGVT